MNLQEALNIINKDATYKGADKKFNTIIKRYNLDKKFLKLDNIEDATYDLTDTDVEFLKFVIDIYEIDPGKRENASSKNFNINNYRKIVNYIRGCIENNNYPLIQKYLKESVSTEIFFSLDLLQKLTDKITKVLAFACENNFADYTIYTQLCEYLDVILYTYAGHKAFIEEYKNLFITNLHINTDKNNSIDAYINSDGSINNIGLYQGVSVYLNDLFQEITGNNKKRLDNYQIDINTSPITITYNIFDIDVLTDFISEYIDQIINVQRINSLKGEDLDKECLVDCASLLAKDIMNYTYNLMCDYNSNPTEEQIVSIKKELKLLLELVVQFFSKENMKQLTEKFSELNLSLLNLRKDIIPHLSQECLWINFVVKETFEKQLIYYKSYFVKHSQSSDWEEEFSSIIKYYKLNLPIEIKQSDQNIQREYLLQLLNTSFAFVKTHLYSMLYLYSDNDIRCQINYKGYKFFLQNIDEMLLCHDKTKIITLIKNTLNKIEQEIESFHAPNSKKNLDLRETLFNSINRDVGIFFRDSEIIWENERKRRHK